MLISTHLKKVFSAAALVSISVFSFVNAAETRYPGIFISDTENRWQVAEYEYENEAQFGYVVCDGGYIGSPLIPNNKKTVDEFLSYCESGKRVGPGQLPVIDVADNHDKNASSYLAYKIDLNGETYNLCKGYLNSTNRCSHQADKRVASLIKKIKGPNIASSDSASKLNQPEIDLVEASGTQIVDFSDGFEQRTNNVTQRFAPQETRGDSNYTRQATTQEIASEISSTLNSGSNGLSGLNLQGINLQGAKVVPLNSSRSVSPVQKQGIEITQQELEALKAGRISLTELIEGRPRVDMGSGLNSIANGSAQKLQAIPISPQNVSSSGKQAIKLTADELDALQNGRISLEQLTASKPIVNVGAPPVANNGKQAIQVTAAELQALSSGQLSLNDLVQNRPAVDLNSQNTGVTQIPISSQLANAVKLSPQSVGANPVAVQSPKTVVKAVPITQDTLAALQSGQVSLDQVISSNQHFNLADFQVQPQLQQALPATQVNQGNLAQQVATVQSNAMAQMQAPQLPSQVQQPSIPQPGLINPQAAPMMVAPQGQIPPQGFQHPVMPQQLAPQQIAMDPSMMQAVPQVQNLPQQFAPEIPQSLTNPQYGAFVPANQGYMQDPMLAQGQQFMQPGMLPQMAPMQGPSMMMGVDPFQQQMMGMPQPMQYGVPAVSPMLQAQNNNFMMSGYQPSPYDFPVMGGMQGNPNAMNYPQGAMPGGYSALGAPVTYVTTPVFSTHSNAQFLPGAVGL